MKKTVKIVFIMMMVIAMLTVVSNAAQQPQTSSGVDPSNFTGSTSAQTGEITALGNNIIQIISTIGSIVSVIILVVLGIKYMMGSAEEKAEYKKTLMPYIIGAALVFAASSIAGMVFSFTSNL